MEKLRLAKDNRSEIIVGGKYRIIRKIGECWQHKHNILFFLLYLLLKHWEVLQHIISIQLVVKPFLIFIRHNRTLVWGGAMNYLRTNYLRRSTQYRKSTAEVIHFERRFYFIFIYEISPPHDMCQKMAEIIRISKKFVSPLSGPLTGAAGQDNSFLTAELFHFIYEISPPCDICQVAEVIHFESRRYDMRR